jgi:hypothetical protein
MFMQDPLQGQDLRSLDQGKDFDARARAHCLRNECLSAFEKYVYEVQKTCALLGELRSRPLSLDQLFAILAQTQAENRSHEAYLLLRQQLFELVEAMEVRTAVS